ncbi:MAG: hypothetical protein HY590_01890 [Candidatus Omnitrophica bacterium]|nr:hypothetical protein [Candidatus Omnitrophota bacterium]
MGEKERFEVLLEEVRDGVKIVAEGLISLRNEMKQEMEQGFQSVRQEIVDLRILFKIFAKQTDQRLALLESKVK